MYLKHVRELFHLPSVFFLVQLSSSFFLSRHVQSWPFSLFGVWAHLFCMMVLYDT